MKLKFKGFAFKPKQAASPNNLKKPKKKRTPKQIWTIVISSIVIVGIVCGTIGLSVMAYMVSKSPNLNVADFDSSESSQLFDQDGNYICDLGVQLRQNISYNDLPQSVIDAFLSVEDSRFFTHNGFDLARFSKALLENIKTLSFEQGGSTFTMQLVKNTYFTKDTATESTMAEKNISRKVQEIFMAMELEKSVSKKKIFELYLNKLNFGGTNSNIRGIQKASEYYFGKNVNELTLSESALLAGVINAPTSYNPYKYLDRATKRRNLTLDLMVRHGYITSEQASIAKSIKVEDLLVGDGVKGSTAGNKNPAYQSYIDAVILEVQELTGLDPTSVSMKIYTNMDPEVQKQIDAIQNEETNVKFPDELMQTAIVSLNNQTGEIVGIGGGRNYNGARILNRAVSMYKQPGSAVKPFLSYALAFEYLGYATSHVLEDKPIMYRGTNTIINNFDGKFTGDVKMEVAFGRSLNIPAILIMQDVVDTVGQKTVAKYLNSLGFSKVAADGSNFDIGYAIGGSTYEASPVEMAGAHATMINGGKYIKPHTVKRIEFNDGSAPVEPTYAAQQVISAESAYLSSYLMKRAVSSDFGNYMQLLQRNYPIYGKTGTSDWGKDGKVYGIPEGAAKDKWMISSSSKYTNAVWVGYDKGVKDKDTYFNNNKNKLNIPGNISKILLDVVHNNEAAPKEITKPGGITEITHILGTFPYASAKEGMDETMITTGMINKKFANLVEPQGADIASLGSFSANVNDKGNITMTWAGYPDPGKLERASDRKDISLYGSNGNKIIDREGQRLFDWSWVYGPVRYKASVMVDGVTVDNISTANNNAVSTAKVNPGSKVKVCGYYAYDNASAKSNEICSEISTKDVDITIPTSSTSLADIEAVFKAYPSIKYEVTEVVASAPELIGKNVVSFNGQEINGATSTGVVKLSELIKGKVVITHYVSKKTSIDNFVGSSKGAVQSWCNSVGATCSFKDKTTNDVAKDNQIASQSIEAGTTHTAEEWKKINIVFEIFRYVNVPTTPPTTEPPVIASPSPSEKP